ncbi:flavin reductase family protein [Paraferrimonas sedimenticola]|uniref:Flavin reductase n=1 Tax=Paraferrimonas sedimenticola TaxID=375674 RepID=A0AA37RWA0_9GAMM|nr:flavin reductase family protein [Paraferrimonas sedimenticola]GLP96411.1 flavin reductase [Paraferrimonas sedimenticola]
MSQSKDFDPQQFRHSLGKFATGVTIITTKAADGELIGMTASSFNSVSLDPPMVLWSIDRRALSLQAFTENEHFAVHVLGESQSEQSNLFARQGADKFGQVATSEGIGGVPLFEEYCARFQCRLVHQYEGGDHVIMVGQVLAFDTTDENPLIFHGGQYRQLAATA